MNRRALAVVAAVVLFGGAAVLACSSFQGSAPADPDAGEPEAAPVDAPDTSADTGSAPVVDAGPPCAACASRQCSDAGSCYPLVFVTSEKFAGDLGSPSDAGLPLGDAICNAEAAEAGRSGVFRAWLSTTDADAIERVTESAGKGRPAIGADGKVIAPFFEAMTTDAGLTNPIQTTAAGSFVPSGEEVWTGTELSGALYAGFTCGDWQMPSGNGGYGFVGTTDQNWTTHDHADCAEAHRLYCFELAP